MDSNFSNDVHINQLKKTLNFKLVSLRRLAPYLTFDRMKKITECLIYSNLMYCLPIYGYEPKFQRTLQKLVNCAARIVLNRGPRASASYMLYELKWLNVHNLYRLECICWLKRIISSKSAPYTLNALLEGSKRKQKSYNTRDCSLQIGLNHSSRYVRQSFIYNAVNEMNLLKLPGRLYPEETEYRQFVKEEILRKYSNSNL